MELTPIVYTFIVFSVGFITGVVLCVALAAFSVFSDDDEGGIE